MILVKKNRRVRLLHLKKGTMFTVKDWDSFAFKSEYRTEQGACECYINGTGEMFWGGCKTAKALNDLLVIPIEIQGSF